MAEDYWLGPVRRLESWLLGFAQCDVERRERIIEMVRFGGTTIGAVTAGWRSSQASAA
jgi:hypothetical protein